MFRLTILLFVAAACRAQTINPLAGDPKAAETGRWTFRILCAPCHGIHADGGRGPDLTRGAYSAGDQDKDLYNAIARGIPGSEMPAYGDRLDADAVWRLVSYVRSVARHDAEIVQGDAAAGEKAFWGKGGCGQCHRVGSKGSGIGPDLTRAGRQRSLQYLRASVLTPNADITPGYGTVKVVLKDGKIISGIERSIDNFSVQLIDLNGRYFSFVREDVTSMAREPRSLMSSYEKLFTPGELNDLLAYLVSLRGSR
ncbi:MAG TPA: c-type cytochrome [Bryobacteraceae bacterium]|nr:c-type cytochrome [Bryobacteraceae bacterium]